MSHRSRCRECPVLDIHKQLGLKPGRLRLPNLGCYRLCLWLQPVCPSSEVPLAIDVEPILDLAGGLGAFGPEGQMQQQPGGSKGQQGGGKHASPPRRTK